MKTKTKNQKPIEIDAHFKYRCSANNCGFDHWISIKEAQTKNFKIVCDCGSVFSPKRIKKLKIIYAVNVIKTTNDNSNKKNESVAVEKIPVDLQNSCVKLLVGYGFTKNESLELSSKAFAKHKVTNAGLLIKYILQNLEELNVS
jgi:hypothetical protein